MKKSFIISALLVVFVTGFSACGGKGKSGKNDILEFWVGGVQYSPETGNKFYHLYEKTGVDTWTGLVSMPAKPSKVVISPKATIDPPITEEKNFLDGVTYTVTAENGDKKTYTVKAEKTAYLN